MIKIDDPCFNLENGANYLVMKYIQTFMDTDLKSELKLESKLIIVVNYKGDILEKMRDSEILFNSKSIKLLSISLNLDEVHDQLILEDKLKNILQYIKYIINDKITSSKIYNI